jgi:hypothetical protein
VIHERKIQAIPTDFAGIRYRSRTEAKWARFFMGEGIPFRYEAEGFQTKAGWYVPDFQFSSAKYLTFFEVKPTQPTAREYRVLAALANGAGAWVFVAHGAPSKAVMIERVASDGELSQWFFAYERQSKRCGYLVNNLQSPTEDLQIRTVLAGPSPTAPWASLDVAGLAHFSHAPPRTNPVASSSLLNSKLVRGED